MWDMWDMSSEDEDEDETSVQLRVQFTSTGVSPFGIPKRTGSPTVDRRRRPQTDRQTGGLLQEVCFRRSTSGGLLQEVCFRRSTSGGLLQEVYFRRSASGGVESLRAIPAAMMASPPKMATMDRIMALRPKRRAPSTLPCCRLFRD
ncbi:hypothetical protein EYF80_061139 [Liparis tanakae]|uniref:Uncharacterized protein n=1 Tax=Liparis tanakae TaxID=230148 RepID=A0A4Z2EIQ6_9TELE|nr:hypothetical protein EYF80_061139 [Liparis tanakae]